MRSFKLWILCVSLQLYAFFLNVSCDETDALNDEFEEITPELKDIHSFFYISAEDLESSTMQTKKNDQAFTMIQPQNHKELNERSTQEAIFYRRLIAVLLSKLSTQRIGDKLIGTISIDASTSQFEYLQNFINGHGSIREVDRILDDVIKQPEYSACHYMAEAFYYFNLLLELVIHYLLIMKEHVKEHWDITVISFTVVSSFIILRRQQCSRGLVIFLIIDVIFILSFFITWWRLVQEAEIKLMAAQAQFAEMPIACKPHKMGIWDKVVASFWSTNDCEKYYATIMTNPRLQVTPMFALTYFLSTVIFQPISHFGLVMSEFINNITDKLTFTNFLYQYPIIISLSLSFCICIILLPLVLFGGSINLGFGPFFKFGIKGREKSNKKQEHIDRIYENTSSRNQLKGPEKLKQITQENDPAGGDANSDTHCIDEEHEKCIVLKKEDVKEDNNEKGDGDC